MCIWIRLWFVRHVDSCRILFFQQQNKKHKNKSKVNLMLRYQNATYGLIIDLKVSFECGGKKNVHAYHMSYFQRESVEAIKNPSIEQAFIFILEVCLNCA